MKVKALPPMKVKAQIRVKWQADKQATKKKEVWKTLSLKVFRGTNHADPLILNFSFYCLRQPEVDNLIWKS